MALHITMAIDRGYEMPLGIALLSLAEQHSASEGMACSVTVLCSGRDPEDCSLKTTNGPSTLALTQS